ncbi:MAG: hypothetical protein ACM3NQ_16015, partial [Bacteroidales bacterium]
DLLSKTRELIASCPCESGCPSCVGPLGETGPLAKAVALEILSRLPSTPFLPSSDGADDDTAFPTSEWA